MTKLDISQCEFEPVRFIGAIQSFGALLVLDESQSISHVSGNIQTYLNKTPESLLGQKFTPDLLSDELVATRIKNGRETLIELEKAETHRPSELSAKLDRIQNAKNLTSLLDQAAIAVWEVTGIDRVMIYKFHEDFHGEVVAEARSPGVESFMGLHYPASDIPPQARAIFLENWVRIIPDVHTSPIELIGKPTDKLDLGKSLLRAVSPIHLEYLKNMEVGASLTISIIVEGKLWGLMACHHRTPFMTTKPLRESAEIIGRMTSALIRETEIRELHSHGVNLKQELHAVSSRLADAIDIGEELTKKSPTLIELIQSGGAAAALYVEGNWISIGNVPSDDDLDELVDWLTTVDNGDVYKTHELSTVFPAALKYKKIASGLLAVPIPKSQKHYVLWFRPEVIQTVKWAGNPDKTVATVNGRLTPRASFDEWKESVEGRSLPWKSWEISAATDIKNMIMGVDLKRQFEKEKVARAEAEEAKLAREELMEVVSHDLKNPLSSVLMNAQLLRRFMPDIDDKTKSVLERIIRSSTTMNNLIEDILNVTKLEAGQMELDLKHQSLDLVIDDAIEILRPLATEKNIRLDLTRDSVSCETVFDYGRILQVFSNIIGNAIKFTPTNGSILVTVMECGPEFVQIRIKDTGAGIPKEHLKHIFDRFWQAKEAKRMGTGLGLAIVKGILESHGGIIEAESELGKGTTFLIKIPKV